MSNDYAAQVESCARNKTAHLKLLSKNAQRCRPTRPVIPSPATEPFRLGTVMTQPVGDFTCFSDFNDEAA